MGNSSDFNQDNPDSFQEIRGNQAAEMTNPYYREGNYLTIPVLLLVLAGLFFAIKHSLERRLEDKPFKELSDTEKAEKVYLDPNLLYELEVRSWLKLRSRHLPKGLKEKLKERVCQKLPELCHHEYGRLSRTTTLKKMQKYYKISTRLRNFLQRQGVKTVSEVISRYRYRHEVADGIPGIGEAVIDEYNKLFEWLKQNASTK